MTSAAPTPHTPPARAPIHAWVDASAGVAGDMLLGALLDAGARLDTVQQAVDAVIPQTVRLTAETVRRAEMRCCKATVQTLATDHHHHRSWQTIRTLLTEANLDGTVRRRALAVFARLAEAEGRVHGVDADQVRFHEVGAWDSIADIVGVCAALTDLNVTSLTVSTIALGSGRKQADHGDIPVPVPAVLELSTGWSVTGGGDGELATPTGVALLTALADGGEPLPLIRVEAVGIGAGTRDSPDRPNVVRVVLGRKGAGPAGPDGQHTLMWVLEANVDDLDPRVWPTVLDALLASGAADAWLTPILMKKGRPAHTLAVLTIDTYRDALRRRVYDLTSTIGIRETAVQRSALAREWRSVQLSGGEVRIKVTWRDGVIVHATPEFDDVAALAASTGSPVRQVLDAAVAAAGHAGLSAGSPMPGVSG